LDFGKIGHVGEKERRLVVKTRWKGASGLGVPKVTRRGGKQKGGAGEWLSPPRTGSSCNEGTDARGATYAKTKGRGGQAKTPRAVPKKKE